MAQELSESVSEGGNTKTPLNKRIPASKRWCFTFNNYEELDVSCLSRLFEIDCERWVFGFETAPTTNTHHLQGYVCATKAMRPIEHFGLPGIHWEKARGGDISNWEYCTKGQKYKSGGDWSEILPKKPRTIQVEDFYPWQYNVYQMIEDELWFRQTGQNNDRKIIWIWNAEGNNGKTQFCKYLAVEHGAIPLEGKKSDILSIAMKFDAPIYVVDVERSCEDFFPYGALEKIKNGFYMCGKYEGGIVVRDSPIVLVFANFEPDVTKMSMDRWEIHDVARMNQSWNWEKRRPSSPETL